MNITFLKTAISFSGSITSGVSLNSSQTNSNLYSSTFICRSFTIDKRQPKVSITRRTDCQTDRNVPIEVISWNKNVTQP